MLRVSFIGAGNVATRMAERLRQVGCEVVQICSRTGTPVSELDPDRADVVVVAVSDDAIAPVLASVTHPGTALWVHTAGSVGIDVFDPSRFHRRGVLYPLQTLLKNRPVDWRRVPLLVEGDPLTLEIARMMSPSVAEVDSGSRRRLHAAAVIGCNMVMYLWTLCNQLTERHGLDFDMLKPLLSMTLDRAMEMSPADAMTGPARRGDLSTIEKHIAALPPDIAPTYRFLSDRMLDYFNHKPDSPKNMIPYDLNKLRAFVFDVDGVLSPNMVPIDENGAPARMANVKDGYALQLAVKHGYKIALITGADTKLVYKRYELLGIKDIFLKASDKLPILKEWMESNGLQPHEVAYCGDDVPDLPCLRHVGLGIAPADASVDAREAADYVSDTKGGEGLARELIEQTMRTQGEWLHVDTAYGW